VLLLFVWAASIAAIFGVVTAGVAITRQTLVHSGSPAMMTRDGLIVQTQAALETQDTSSALPDTVWQRLKYFNLEGSNNSWLQLDVLSTARVYGTGSLGSIVRVRRALWIALLAAALTPRPARRCTPARAW
jgi:hypothetical protein